MSLFQVAASVLIVGLLSFLVGYLVGKQRKDKPEKQTGKRYQWKGPTPPMHGHCRCVIEPEPDSDNSE